MSYYISPNMINHVIKTLQDAIEQEDFLLIEAAINMLESPEDFIEDIFNEETENLDF